MNDFQNRVGMWAESVFTRATPGSIVAHLRREVEELGAATHLGPWEDEVEEAADCLLLLLHLAHKRGYSLLAAATAKFGENQQRRWGQPDAEGVVEHVRPDAPGGGE
jgi:NTP pyrophosphatase (non-canonical NTP hydrolase)